MLKIKNITNANEQEEILAMAKKILMDMKVGSDLKNVEFAIDETKSVPTWVAYNTNIGAQETYNKAVVIRNAILLSMFSNDVTVMSKGLRLQIRELGVESTKFGYTNAISVLSLLVASSFDYYRYVDRTEESIKNINSIAIASGAYTRYIMKGLNK